MLVPERNKKILAAHGIGANATFVSESVPVPKDARAILMQSAFTYAAGGGTAKAFLQTTFDGGATWADIMCHAFTTSTAKKVSSVKQGIALAAAIVTTDGSITDDTIKDGMFGDRVRVKLISASTVYTGATLINVNLVIG